MGDAGEGTEGAGTVRLLRLAVTAALVLGIALTLVSARGAPAVYGQTGYGVDTGPPFQESASSSLPTPVVVALVVVAGLGAAIALLQALRRARRPV